MVAIITAGTGIKKTIQKICICRRRWRIGTSTSNMRNKISSTLSNDRRKRHSKHARRQQTRRRQINRRRKAHVNFRNRCYIQSYAENIFHHEA